jgi:hypothetical protein
MKSLHRFTEELVAEFASGHSGSTPLHVALKAKLPLSVVFLLLKIWEALSETDALRAAEQEHPVSQLDASTLHSDDGKAMIRLATAYVTSTMDATRSVTIRTLAGDKYTIDGWEGSAQAGSDFRSLLHAQHPDSFPIVEELCPIRVVTAASLEQLVAHELPCVVYEQLTSIQLVDARGGTGTSRRSSTASACFASAAKRADAVGSTFTWSTKSPNPPAGLNAAGIQVDAPVHPTTPVRLALNVGTVGYALHKIELLLGVSDTDWVATRAGGASKGSTGSKPALLQAFKDKVSLLGTDGNTLLAVLSDLPAAWPLAGLGIGAGCLLKVERVRTVWGTLTFARA